MFGPLGFQEVLLILGLALLIFGPRELPKIGRTIGRAMGEFRKASSELKRSLNTEMLQEELRQNDPRRLVRETAKELEAAAMAEDPESGEDTADEGSSAAPATGSAIVPAADPPAEDEPAEDESAAGEPAADGPADGSSPVPRDRSATGAGS